MTTKAKEKWRPKNCHRKYASYYEIHTQKAEEPKVVSPPDECQFVSEEVQPDVERKWCSGCMSSAVDPMTLACGHHFCRSCIAHSRNYLIQEHRETITDIRAELKCPVSACKTTLLCFPIINGDTRFQKQHSKYSMITKFL
ncbi:hypothetical protein BsWGS_12037 [Bradybaena similaris]